MLFVDRCISGETGLRKSSVSHADRFCNGFSSTRPQTWK